MTSQMMVTCTVSVASVVRPKLLDLQLCTPAGQGYADQWEIASVYLASKASAYGIKMNFLVLALAFRN
jgi:hypothetical protein